MRAWYAGKVSPDEEAIARAEEADGHGQVLYDHNADSNEGEYADLVKGVYDMMDTLKRNPLEFRTWTEEDGYETFLTALFDFGPTALRDRVQILQQAGSFKFRQVDTSDDKKDKISAVFADPEEEDLKAGHSAQARRLSGIWTPQDGSLLNAVILQPAQVGRILSDRLNPTSDTPFKLIGHSFEDVHSATLKPLSETKTVAYERGSEIHLITDVAPILANWDADSPVAGGCEKVTLLEALLLHELVELVLDESQPELDPLLSHIIASTFERYLKSTALSVAVEDFFLTWPNLSAAELEERHELELAEQLAAASAFLGEEDVPDENVDDLDDLPMDPSKPTASKKSPKVRKKTSGGDRRPKEDKPGKKKAVNKEEAATVVGALPHRRPLRFRMLSAGYSSSGAGSVAATASSAAGSARNCSRNSS